MQAIALLSHDRGATWPEWITVVDQYDQGVVSWEQGLTQLADGRLLAVVWCFNEKTGRSLPNRFALSADGKRFSAPRENGLQGETAKLLTLDDGRVLCLYRRTDKPGLWASLVRIQGDDWVNLAEMAVWRGPASGMKGQGAAGDELSALKFGFPSMVQLPDGDVLAVFWCMEECLHVIRWARLKIGNQGSESYRECARPGGGLRRDDEAAVGEDCVRHRALSFALRDHPVRLPGRAVQARSHGDRAPVPLAGRRRDLAGVARPLRDAPGRRPWLAGGG
jgi:hypothetical protein